MVLALDNLRYKATDEDIKNAYRKQVLKHHPDKKVSKAVGHRGIDAIFKCIQKAWETLSDPTKRQQFDSVDSGVDDTPPTEAEIKDWLTKGESYWYTQAHEIFEREGRFSKRKPLPVLGDDSSPREQVDQFYSFWYNLDSWRSFEYEDKEDVDNSENRGDKRWIEKKNKAERARKKTEDNARLRKIIDLMLKYDPRIQRFREEDKLAKKKKQQQGKVPVTKSSGKVDVAAEKAAAELKKQEEEKLEQLAKEQAELEKQNKKEAKEKIKKDKKAVKNLIVKDFTYLHENPTSQLMEKTLADLELIFEAVKEDALELQLIREKLEHASNKGLAGVRAAFMEELERVKQELADSELRKQRQVARAEAASKRVIRTWTPKELQLLIKAANMFPGGTIDRWEKIAEYVMDHSGEKPMRTTSDVIAMSRQVQNSSGIDEKALKELQGHQKKHNDTYIKDEPSIRDEYESGPKPQKENQADKDGWTAAQQAQLQKALALYPANYKENDRFDRIAELVDGKTKKDCISRTRHLAEQIKAKRSAQ
jgi:DnaJ family protein C protein 2